MANEWNARPVSGEIMTAAPAAAPEPYARSERGADIVDAQFEAVAFHGLPEDRATTARPSAGPPLLGMDVLRRARPATERGAYGGPFFLLGVVTLAAAAFWISGGYVLLPLESASVAVGP